MTLIEKIIRMFKSTVCNQVLPWRFTGRLSEDDIVLFCERSLGRRLSQVELAAIERDFRPQGLLTDKDSYLIRIASDRYLGHPPTLEIYSTALDGYADGCPTLVLAESADLHFRDGYADEHLDTLVA